MMLTPLTFNYQQCLKEAQELKTFLGSHTSLKERGEILPFFKDRHHLSAFLSVNNARAVQYDRIAHEYPMFGDFTCDLVAGDWSRSAFVFVEFENAAVDSVFVQKTRATPEWSSRFEHGFSQILDWFYKMDTQRHSADFEHRFGSRDVHVSGLLVVGRKQDLGPREKERLNWRHQHVTVHGKQIYSMTFDDLCEDTLERLSRFPALKKAFKGAPPKKS
jgi:hypothetical protein